MVAQFVSHQEHIVLPFRGEFIIRPFGQFGAIGNVEKVQPKCEGLFVGDQLQFCIY